MRMGEGREPPGRWGGEAYVRGWEGPRRRGGGGGGSGCQPQRKEVGGRERRSSRASGQRSPPLSWLHCLLSLPPQSPPPGTDTAHGIIIETPCPAPCPLGGEGEGEGKWPAWGGRGRGRKMMAPTRHRETGPAAASPHAALSHSRGCDRDGGSRERGRGRPLKEQQLRWHRGLLGTGDRGQLFSWGGRGPRAPWPAGRGPDPASHQHFANAWHLLPHQAIPLWPALGPSFGCPFQRKRGFPGRGSKWCFLRRKS